MTNGPRCGRRLPQLHVGAPSQMGRRARAVQAFCPMGKTLLRSEFTSGRGCFNRVPTGAERACGWSCIREPGATPTSKKMTNGPRYGRRLPQLHVGAPSQMGRRACAVQAFCPKDKTLPRTEFTSGRGFSIGSPQARNASVGGAAPQNGGERGFLMNITGPRCGCGFPQLHAGARLLFVPFRRMGRRWFPS